MRAYNKKHKPKRFSKPKWKFDVLCSRNMGKRNLWINKTNIRKEIKLIKHNKKEYIIVNNIELKRLNSFYFERG